MEAQEVPENEDARPYLSVLCEQMTADRPITSVLYSSMPPAMK